MHDAAVRAELDVRQQAAANLSKRITRTLRIGRERLASRRECPFIAGTRERRDATRRDAAGVARRRWRKGKGRLLQPSATAPGVVSSRPAGGVWRKTHTVSRPSEASIHSRKNTKAIMSESPDTESARKVRAKLATWLPLRAVMGEACSQNCANRLAKCAEALSGKESVRAHNCVSASKGPHSAENVAAVLRDRARNPFLSPPM